MELIFIAMFGLIIAGGEGDNKKHIVCPVPVMQEGKLVYIEGECPDVTIGSVVDPEDPVYPEDPDGKVKSDNSDANGKGGNKHNREDKDKPAQEIAENKKK